MSVRPKPKLLHPRNRHQGHYDFNVLKAASPELTRFVAINPYGNESIDFSDPEAVKALNRALLKSYYGISNWDIPKNALCPPIPGRADYIHLLADLLASSNGGQVPEGKNVRILDIGVGASAIYPMIGHCEYGWSFRASDINPISLQSVQAILKANPKLESAIELRLQNHRSQIFTGIIHPKDCFDATLCNPPFHASLEEAQAGTRRKWKNLGKKKLSREAFENFGGQGAELWCEGGELAFIRNMIQESINIGHQCRWFTTLVSKAENLPKIHSAIKAARAKEYRTLEMAQGQKKSRIVAWTFRSEPASQNWNIGCTL